jgi:hypothetical protein
MDTLYYCASLTVIFLYMIAQIISVDAENCESTHDVICVSLPLYLLKLN